MRTVTSLHAMDTWETMASYQCFVLLLLFLWLRYKRTCRRRLLQRRIKVGKEKRTVARMLKDEAHLEEREIRRKRRRRCVVYRWLRYKKSAHLISVSSCFCHAYSLGQSFNHVITPPLNHQSASLHVKPPIDMVWGYCGLVRVTWSRLRRRSGKFPFAPC